MTSPTPPAPSAIPGTAAIRVGIALLAAFAFALSYDALCQMAVAIHVRGVLTYAFPLVIDGFIAIGVGALLMLRTAPLRSRVYVWGLVGAATVTSIWANALHAVRLNQQARHGDGLRLDDLTVGILSAVAPLALAGAVHLYIVIRRHPASPHQAGNAAGIEAAGDHHDNDRGGFCPPAPLETDRDLSASAAVSAEPDSDSEVPAHTAPPPRRAGRPPNASLEELVAMGRPVVERTGQVDRDAVAEEIREVQGRKVSNDRLQKVINILAEEHDEASASIASSV
ncbi:DUF2637 domain-containing protein [Streptomyces sp. NPDC013157]|uniref:DUF2637 domain-containing protein n=1 Tax=Streptomyces sp. NPDC013157 TaxID=3364861 RepID=UPI0036C99DD9